ncbi:hypothetical protein RFI_32136 [Reticulomyxa filosa]|uniref:Uncharacterized protein n=1 Tax=Reticulomyxa filosa TaxID=46433 RepID=X6LWZ7_RETFI|nr:hypothetical protein RFI_32136 [Reticulomyxa filosa]|eukprot:ETO05260.1 hypothetical protein RFI_32136 [Reticulomyxa filosa]
MLSLFHLLHGFHHHFPLNNLFFRCDRKFSDTKSKLFFLHVFYHTLIIVGSFIVIAAIFFGIILYIHVIFILLNSFNQFIFLEMIHWNILAIVVETVLTSQISIGLIYVYFEQIKKNCKIHKNKKKRRQWGIGQFDIIFARWISVIIFFFICFFIHTKEKDIGVEGILPSKQKKEPKI